MFRLAEPREIHKNTKERGKKWASFCFFFARSEGEKPRQHSKWANSNYKRSCERRWFFCCKHASWRQSPKCTNLQRCIEFNMKITKSINQCLFWPPCARCKYQPQTIPKFLPHNIHSIKAIISRRLHAQKYIAFNTILAEIFSFMCRN